ncbi:MAG: SRPBCC family protein [Silicimonas sp.]|nr:SRPBCC family protein [Silicimonas sp.]
MKFSSREDIEAPVSRVFEAVTDFDRFERQLLRRGVDITRDESCPPTDIGANWQAKFPWRGRTHAVVAELVTFEPENGFAFESRSGGVICMGVVDLVALSKSRTRLFVSLDLRPTTLSSRLFIQSLKLAKGSLSRKFKARVSDWAARIET